MQTSICFHLIGMVLWLGGLLLLTRIMRSVSKLEQQAVLIPLFSRLFWGFVIPGAAISLLTGMIQLSLGGMKHYMALGWMHTKLTLVLVLLVQTVVLAKELALAKERGTINASRTLMIHALTGLCLFGIIFLTILGRI